MYYTITKEVRTMKKDIHPEYKKTTIKCVCGNEIETGSVEENITVDICSACHPFFTGNQKILDSEGRVERKRREKAGFLFKKFLFLSKRNFFVLIYVF